MLYTNNTQSHTTVALFIYRDTNAISIVVFSFEHRLEKYFGSIVYTVKKCFVNDLTYKSFPLKSLQCPVCRDQSEGCYKTSSESSMPY